MSDCPRTDQEQQVADLFRLWGFNVKLNYWPAGLERNMEIDVYAVRPPLRVAVECKKYSSSPVGRENIQYFADKLKLLPETVGVFVANWFSNADLQLCRDLHIAAITTQQIQETYADLSARSAAHHIAVTHNTWLLLGALRLFGKEWDSYITHSPFQKEITATTAFEIAGLIQTHRKYSHFGYEYTELGEWFFNSMARLLELIEPEDQFVLSNRATAIEAIKRVCIEAKDGMNWGTRVMLIGLGLRDQELNVTKFARLLGQIASLLETSTTTTDHESLTTA